MSRLRRFVRLLSVSFAIAILASVAVSDESSAQSPEFKSASSQFLALPLQQKHELQMLLAIAGYSQAVSLDVLSPNIFDAIRRFQADMGVPTTGAVTPDQIERLRVQAAPLLSQWKLEATNHPETGSRLWIPRGLVLKTERTQYGVAYLSEQHRVRIEFDYFSSITIEEAYRITVEVTSQRSSIHYRIMRPDFFVVASGSSGIKRYVRYQAFRGGIVGFAISYPPDAPLNGDRLSTIMSDLFRSSVGLGYAIFPPAAPRSDPEVQVNRPPKQEKGALLSTGTAFAITASGDFVTNAHVIENCKSIVVALNNQSSPARVLALDKINDLAVVATELKPEAIAQIKSGTRLGEEVAVFGFPLLDKLASTGNFTRGSVTATAGLSDDTRYLQFQAPVQTGNSGGPLLDQQGNVIGVVTLKLDALKVASQSGELPQNVNFAVKSSILLSFLEANGIRPVIDKESRQLSWPDIADNTKRFTALVICISN